MAKKPAPKIKHVAWRNGRPRFEPSKTLRDAGHKGYDLRNGADWMTPGEAFEWSQTFQRELDRTKAAGNRQRTAPSPVEPPPPAYPLSLLFAQWLSPKHNPAITDRAKKTIYEYQLKQNVLEKHLPDAWHAEAAALTRPICLGMYDILRAKVGISQAASTMRVLGIALKWAIDRAKVDLPANPAHQLSMKVPDPRIRFATRAEIEQLIRIADAIGRPELGDMVALGVWSGQRQSDRLLFSLAARATGRITLRQEKTKAIVSMPEAPELRQRLTAAEQRRKLAQVIFPHVILNERAWEPFKQDYYAHLYGELRDIAAKGLPATPTRAEIPPMPSLAGRSPEQKLPLRDQDLRDTTVTWLALGGATIPEICAITGHSLRSAHEILKHYLALNEEMANSAMAKMIAWYDGHETKEEAK